MATVKDLGESKYLAKEDVGAGMTVTITGWDRKDVSRDSDPTSYKYILTIKEHKKPFVLNKTNGKKIAEIVGSDDFDHWVGKQVILWNNPDVEFQGETTGGIRVRSPHSSPNAVKAAVRAAKANPAMRGGDDCLPPTEDEAATTEPNDPPTGKDIPF